MKFAISGSQCTGKSTLLYNLQNDTKYSKYIFTGGITRKLQKNGEYINEDGNDNTQLRIMAKHIETAASNKDKILDRCALDGYVYTLYLYKQGKVTLNTLQIAESVFTNLHYDILFYIAPEFQMVDDGTRSIDVKWQKDIADLFEEVFTSFNISPIRLHGTVKERIEQFNDAVDKFIKWTEENKTPTTVTYNLKEGTNE